MILTLCSQETDEDKAGSREGSWETEGPTGPEGPTPGYKFYWSEVVVVEVEVIKLVMTVELYGWWLHPSVLLWYLDILIMSDNVGHWPCNVSMVELLLIHMT